MRTREAAATPAPANPPGQRSHKLTRACYLTTRQLNRLFHETADGAGIRKGARISSVSVSCLPCRSLRSIPSRRPAPRLRRALSPRSQKHQSIHALAAAATCASSRPSCAGNSRNTNPRQFRQRSGSTPHDDGTDARHMQNALNVCVGFQPTTLSLASSRQCCRSPKLKSARLRYKHDP